MAEIYLYYEISVPQNNIDNMLSIETLKIHCIRQFNSIEYIQSNLYLEVISVIKKEWFSKIDDLLKEVQFI
jgi:hypothetical protein